MIQRIKKFFRLKRPLKGKDRLIRLNLTRHDLEMALIEWEKQRNCELLVRYQGLCEYFEMNKGIPQSVFGKFLVANGYLNTYADFYAPRYLPEPRIELLEELIIRWNNG